MNVGVVGLGKVGLPLALVLRHYGRHNVIGYDKDPERVERHQRLYANNSAVHPEQLLRELLAVGPIPVAPDLATLVRHCDTVIVIVDTPHPPQYDTSLPLPATRDDFDYTNLQAAIDEVMGQAITQQKALTLIISSTVSPGTTRRLTIGHPPSVGVGYNPVLISLGSVVADLLAPDMILAGAEDPQVWRTIRKIWTPVVNTAPIVRLRTAEAEIAKLVMNAFLSFKIAFAGAVAQMADRWEGNADRILLALSYSRQVTSDRYLRAGLSDGGACRPRDTITLEHACERSGIDGELWAVLTEVRELHTWWLAEKIERLHAQNPQLPIYVCGTAYKPEVPYTDGSVGLLLRAQMAKLDLEAETWDPVVDGYNAAEIEQTPALTPPFSAMFIITCAHPEIMRFLVQETQPGSIIVDPIGCLTGLVRPGVTLIQPGRS